MNSDQIEVLSGRLREIGFSERAVTMIVEQVQEIDTTEPGNAGLAEPASTFELPPEAASVPVRLKPMNDPRPTPRLFGIVGALVSFLSLVFGWTALTTSGSGELAIMASTTESGPSWLRGAQALLLAGWVAVPPLWSAVKRSGDATGFLRHKSALTIWGAFGLLLATLLLASAA